MPTISQTSPIRKNSLSGISGVGMASGHLCPLLDYNRRPREWKPLADAVFDEPLEREVQFLDLVRKHDKRWRVDFHLRNETNLYFRRQSAPRQHFSPEELVQILRRNP